MKWTIDNSPSNGVIISDEHGKEVYRTGKDQDYELFLEKIEDILLEVTLCPNLLNKDSHVEVKHGSKPWYDENFVVVNEAYFRNAERALKRIEEVKWYSCKECGKGTDDLYKLRDGKGVCEDCWNKEVQRDRF